MGMLSVKYESLKLFNVPLLTCFLFAFAAHVQGQNQHLTYGTGATPMALSSDYRALGWNPAHITLSPLIKDDWKNAAGGFEFGARISSNALDKADLWAGFFDKEAAGFDVQSAEWQDWKGLLANEDIALNVDVTAAATAKRWKKWGVAYSSRQHFQAEMLLDVSSVELLLEGPVSWFELLITNQGDTVQNNGGLTEEDLSNIASGIDLNGDAILSNLLSESRLGFSWHRAHTVGLSKEWQLKRFKLHTGFSGRLLLGNGYFQLSQQNGALDAFGAFSNGFNVPSFVSSNQSNLPQTIRNWGPVGQGWGVDIGAAIEWGEKIWASAAITDIGFMDWRGERYSIGSISIGNSNLPNDLGQNWIDVTSAALDPSSWFSSSVAETRRISNGPSFHIGGGIQLIELVTIAADASFDNPELLGNSGTRLGVSFVLQPLPFLRIDGGISKWGNETIRFPLGLIFITGKKGFECGIQATDVQSAWESSQPEIGLRACFMRWVW